MKIFLTGGTGFIGSHFVNESLANGVEVVALRRSPASQPRIVLNAEPQWLDCALDEVNEKSLCGCDVIVHLAAHTPNVPYDTLENCLRWNVLAPLALFRTAMRAGIDRFVVAGSCFEYGEAGERYDFIPPNAPLEPTQTYPASKAAASVVFGQFAREQNLRLSIHRIFQVFGEGEQAGRLWPSLRRAALAGDDLDMTAAEQIRDFIPVETVAKTLLAACAREDVKSGVPLVENLGTGVPQTLKNFAEYWWRHWNACGQLRFGVKPYRKGEVMRFVPALTHAEGTVRQ